MKACAVWISNGRIQNVVSLSDVPAGVHVEDLGDSVIFPGLVDSHVHINEPGRTEWEGFITATRAAAAGGITTLVDMPLNSTPVTTTARALNEKLSAARDKLWVDCGFYGGFVPGNSHDFEPLIKAGVLGFKAFLIHSGIDDFPNVTEADLREGMPILAKHNIPLLVHAELDCGQNKSAHSHAADARSYQGFLSSRPAVWEMDAIRLMIDLCREYTSPVHIVHLSSADAVPLIREAKAQGLPLTVETCPHYLTFSSEEIADGDTRFKCTPPIREKENQERLWQALEAGVIDFIVSDHSPCTPELKLLEQGDFQAAWGGIASLQFGLPAVWTEARQRGYSLNDIARWMSGRPAEFLGLGNRKGSIAKGFDADLVILDSDANFTVDPSNTYHKNKVTPYQGKTLQGVVRKTYLKGQLIYDQDDFSHVSHGKSLIRETQREESTS
ncbi:MAG: allantoinase AllB [Pyrinomonadaceae bacterium]|nr:allantoinase AllB [Pyrinomonadaceae bacterium]